MMPLGGDHGEARIMWPEVRSMIRFLYLSVLTCALPTGCATNDRLVYANFEAVRPHASNKEEVTQLLGEPERNLGERWIYERPDKHLHAIIDFDGSGKVERKQWIDAMSTDKTWIDSKEKGSGKH
jgi:hypothetical protein